MHRATIQIAGPREYEQALFGTASSRDLYKQFFLLRLRGDLTEYVSGQAAWVKMHLAQKQTKRSCQIRQKTWLASL